MHTLKSSSFLRPASRPSSPLPNPPVSRTDTEVSIDRTPRYHTKLSLSTFRKPSPAPSRETQLTPLVQDGSYLEALSLKLTEAVAKALAQPAATAGAGDVLNGKRAVPAGRGRTLGQLIASELNASNGNHHLQRAILRSLQRPLSALTTTLSSNVLPLLSSPAFSDPLTPTVLQPNSNSTQLHALGLARVAGEVLETFDLLEIGLSNDPRGDGLRSIRDNLNSLVTRVVGPLLTGIKNETCPLIQGLEKVNPASLPNNQKPLVITKSSNHPHPSISALQTIIPIYAKALSRYTVAPVCCPSLATLLICFIWRGLVALSHRPLPPSSRPNSLNALTTSIGNGNRSSKKRLASSTTPPSTPPAGRFNIKLPPSRPPSPPSAMVPSVAADAATLYNLLNLLPRPKEVDEGNVVAQEAVDDAFAALKTLAALLDATSPEKAHKDDLDLDLLTSGLPTLIALPVLFRWAGHGESQRIPMILGLTDSEYRDGCLCGFGRAEEYASAAGQRILNLLSTEHPDDSRTTMVTTWLQARVNTTVSN